MPPGGRNMEITLCWACCLLVGERLVSGSTRTLRDTRSLQCVTTGNTKAACRSGTPGSELNKLGVNPGFGGFLPSGLFDKPPPAPSSLHISSSRLSSSLVYLFQLFLFCWWPHYFCSPANIGLPCFITAALFDLILLRNREKHWLLTNSGPWKLNQQNPAKHFRETLSFLELFSQWNILYAGETLKGGQVECHYKWEACIDVFFFK